MSPSRPASRISSHPARLITFGALMFTGLALLLNTKMRASPATSLGWLALSAVNVDAAAPLLNVTTLTSRDGYSLLECWQLTSVPVDNRSAMNYRVGNTSYAEWSIIEPRTTVGEAWALSAQCVSLFLSSPLDQRRKACRLTSDARITVVLNGLIRVSVPPPSCTKDACPSASVGYFMPGTLSSSMLFALDTKETSTKRGHYTEFPSDEQTVLLQMPFANSEVPEHTVLYDGPCKE